MAYHRSSYDSTQRPLTDVRYHSPYTSNDPYYTQSTGYLAPPPVKKKKTSKWLKIGLPIIIIVIAAAVVGAVIAIRDHNKASSASTGSGGSSSGNNGPNPNVYDAVFPSATDSYFLPVYPTITNQALLVEPTFNPNAKLSWPTDPFQPSNPQPTLVRPGRPRVIAPAYKWAALPDLIKGDAYMNKFHNQILANATGYFEEGLVSYYLDGSSGALDVNRRIKQKIKAYAYAYRTTNDTKWVQHAWDELLNASGNSSSSPVPWGTAPDRWNSGHFLDVAEMTAAFGIAYDWLYDAWSQDQRTAIMWSILDLGLSYGLTAFNTGKNGWWTGTSTEINGNWNCVCNGGLSIGALAILGDDPTGMAEDILGKTIPNALKECVNAVSEDGSWFETPNYWYFGTTGYSELTSAFLTATGSDYGLLTQNPNFYLTGLFHMYVFGMTSLFDYGDHGPNKYSTTANSMVFMADVFNKPEYMLYQRDRFDAPEPTMMFWYDPSVEGAWWNNLPLDHYFNNSHTSWVSMRSSWTDNTKMYIAMKSCNLTGHQAHGDLDVGDFVLDAMGQRWAGELGSGDYLSPGYFTSEQDNAERWQYYRKRTEGQNTLLINTDNQLAVEASPTGTFGTTGEAQGASTIFTVPDSSTAFFTTDMSTAYGSGTTAQRGIRFLNQRTQVLLQDDVDSQFPIMWRMQTNATVTINSGGTSATLKLGGKTLQVSLVNPPAGAQFSTMPAVRLSTDPPFQDGGVDQQNPTVTVLTISLAAGSYSLQVLFTPEWPGSSAPKSITPPSVAIGSWSVGSHS